MYTELNIGMDVPGYKHELDPANVICTVEQLFGKDHLIGYRVDVSGDENTVVVRLDLPVDYDLGYEFCGKIYKLALNLGQDCIAVKYASLTGGILIGPDSKSWGRFDSRYFVNYNYTYDQCNFCENEFNSDDEIRCVACGRER